VKDTKKNDSKLK